MQYTRPTTLAALLSAIAFLAPAVQVASAPVPAPGAPGSGAPNVEHGGYLVRTMGCHDCHTPLKMGPTGPERDMSRALTGHPEAMVMPPPPVLPPGPWLWVASATSTAFAGPWGVSFAANLTPDLETGLGKWTDEMFVATMKTGRHQGKGRPVLPPMPVQIVAELNDRDIHDMFAYLKSLKPVSNRVPAPVDPPEPPQ